MASDEIEVVIVATDGSFLARCGILAGSVLGPRFGAGIRLFSAVDDDPATARVLPIARQWARRLAEPLIIVSVAESAPPSVRGGVRRASGPDGDVQAFLDGLVAAELPDEGRLLMRLDPQPRVRRPSVEYISSPYDRPAATVPGRRPRHASNGQGTR